MQAPVGEDRNLQRASWLGVIVGLMLQTIGGDMTAQLQQQAPSVVRKHAVVNREAVATSLLSALVAAFSVCFTYFSHSRPVMAGGVTMSLSKQSVPHGELERAV